MNATRDRDLELLKGLLQNWLTFDQVGEIMKSVLLKEWGDVRSALDEYYPQRRFFTAHAIAMSLSTVSGFPWSFDIVEGFGYNDEV